MNIGHLEALAPQWPSASGDHRNLVSSKVMKELQRVGGGARKREVAGDRGDADDVELGRGAGNKERERVVEAGIGVDDDGRGHLRGCEAAHDALVLAARGIEACSLFVVLLMPASKILRQAKTLIDGRVDVARGDRVADAIKREVTFRVV